MATSESSLEAICVVSLYMQCVADICSRDIAHHVGRGPEVSGLMLQLKPVGMYFFHRNC